MERFRAGDSELGLSARGWGRGAVIESYECWSWSPCGVHTLGLIASNSKVSQLRVWEVLRKGRTVLLVATGLKLVGWGCCDVRPAGRKGVCRTQEMVSHKTNSLGHTRPVNCSFGHVHSDKWTFSCYQINSHWTKELLEIIFNSVEPISYKSCLFIHLFIHKYWLSMCCSIMIGSTLKVGVGVCACPFPHEIMVMVGGSIFFPFLFFKKNK